MRCALLSLDSAKHNNRINQYYYTNTRQFITYNTIIMEQQIGTIATQAIAIATQTGENRVGVGEVSESTSHCQNFPNLNPTLYTITREKSINTICKR